jgi:uncharacterized membrane protein
MLAACAHLSFFTGFWLVAPIAIFLIKRKESRFVAFYALQAALVQVLFGVGTMLFVILCIVLVAAVGVSGRHEAAAIVALVPVLGLVAGGAGLVLVHLFAAYSAWRGNELSIPLAGHLARAIQGADQDAAKI